MRMRNSPYGLAYIFGASCLLLFPTLLVAQNVSNHAVCLAPLGRPGAYQGFTLSDPQGPIAAILFSSNEALIARQLSRTANALRFSHFEGTPTPKLGLNSYVEISLLGKEDPFPRICFLWELQSFEAQAWEKRWGAVPFHFLVCSVPGAAVFHQRGWAIGTPVVDDYIQMKCEGPGKTIVSSWSRHWTYAPPIGAYPTAVAGLWHPNRRLYIGYEFHEPRLTDHSEKEFGTAYCFRHGRTQQFFCLTWPFARNYQHLRYPQVPVDGKPVRVGTHFRLLWSRNMGPEEDPNRFVHEFLWRTYRDQLPAVEPMNDLSWLPGAMRLSDIDAPGPLGSLIVNTGPTGQKWWQPKVHLVQGVFYFSPVDYYYRTGEQASIRKLGQECRRLIELGQWMDIGADRCFFWRTPLDGGGAAMFGPGVETFRHVNGWGAGLALLDYYRNDPESARDLLPYIDGVLLFTKHILYTRNCYPDVPAAQFAWSATPCVTFCLKYYYRFRKDPQRHALAELAYKLARHMTYRYLALWPCDNEEMDDLDASFFMEPNAGQPWLGCACANEIWVFNIAMLYEYISTGDPIMGHYLRGMLERYHELYQEEYYPHIQDYPPSAFTERLGLFAECAQGHGQRANFGGLWGGLERLIWPMGSATVRVVCGEKAAMAFNREGRHTDIMDYRCAGEGNFSFRLVAKGLQADAQKERDVTICFPFFSLRDKSIWIQRGAQRIAPQAEQIVRYRGDDSVFTLKGLKPGDIVIVGALPSDTPILSCEIIKPRQINDGAPPQNISASFRIVNLPAELCEGITQDWQDVQSYAGYEPGVKNIFGVPFLLRDPELTQNRVCLSQGKIVVNDKPQYVFALVAEAQPHAKIIIERKTGREEAFTLQRAVPVLRGWPPIYEWHIDMAVIPNGGKDIQALIPQGCKIFAITLSATSASKLKPTLAILEERQKQIVAEEKLIQQLAALRPLFEALSGQIAVLPVPHLENPRSHPFVRLLAKAGLAPHLVFLTPEDFVNPFVFNRQKISLALHLGISETYYQNIARPYDGDEALRRWLKAGGTLLVLDSGPFPFYYNEKGEAVVSAGKFGLPICGSGVGARADKLPGISIHGWEKPPAGVSLTFRVNRDILPGLPATIPWPEKADPRWRPIVNLVGPGNEYLSLITLQDNKGQSYGDGAAYIHYRQGELAGARVAYVWHSLRADPDIERTLLTALLRFLLSQIEPAPQPQGQMRSLQDDFSHVASGEAPTDIWHILSGEWRVQEGVLIGRNSGTDSWAPAGIVAGFSDWKNYTFRLRFQIRQLGSDHRDGVWIGFRYTSPQACYCVAFQHRLISLHKIFQSRSTNDNVQMAHVDWTPDKNWHELLIHLRDAQITIMLDGKEIMRVQDNNFLDVAPVPAGGICLSARKWTQSSGDTIAAFDDIAVHIE